MNGLLYDLNMGISTFARELLSVEDDSQNAPTPTHELLTVAREAKSAYEDYKANKSINSYYTYSTKRREACEIERRLKRQFNRSLGKELASLRRHKPGKFYDRIKAYLHN